MIAYNFNNSPALKQYHGCGKAWAAIDDGVVQSIKYMGDFRFNYSGLPAWVIAAKEEYYAISDLTTRISSISGPDLGRIKKAAIKAGHPDVGPRGGYIPASRIADSARTILMKEEHIAFGKYREKCRSELEKLGEIVSGMCSCYEFYPLT